MISIKKRNRPEFISKEVKEKIKKVINKKWEVEQFRTFSKIISDFSLAEKVCFYTLCVIFVISGARILENVNTSLMVDVPVNGGSFTEGIVGSPRFINPVLAISDLDHDLSSLI